VPEQHKEIAGELNRLVLEGEAIYLSVEIRHRSAEERKKLAKAIKKMEDAARKAAKAAADKGQPLSNELPRLELLQGKDFRGSYQRWYSEALRVAEQLLPDRYDEFRELYRLDKSPKELNVSVYTISDYIHGTIAPAKGLDEPGSRSVAMSKMKDQIDIVSSAKVRLDSLLANIEGALQATLLDDELETAMELLKAKHLRSAGVVAGVVLERHLKSVLTNHQISLGRKKPQIGNLNDALKQAGVFDNPRWREVQRLGDIRNLCGHDDERAPKAAEVKELIEDTEKIVKTVF
jgi:hypothetical protein